ncbi:hypothetical protein D7X33_09760 [Butyricicoccus sp. 1XD8-22]|nr:hypothetical protein D7X33_09760 [Butyricicoccus sp. 1XD8-22]
MSTRITDTSFFQVLPARGRERTVSLYTTSLANSRMDFHTFLQKAHRIFLRCAFCGGFPARRAAEVGKTAGPQ